jgi:hypothetical protein
VARLGGGMVTLRLTLINQRGEQVQQGSVTIGLKHR